MENKLLIDSVKKWITNNDKLEKLQKEVKLLKNKKKEYTEELVNIMSENNIDVLNLNNDSKLLHKKIKSKGGITKKILISSLSNYIDNEDDILDIVNVILSNRTEKINDSILIK